MVRINAQLWDCPDGREIWRDTYDREGVDLLALQDDIASRILMTSQESKDFAQYSGRPGSIATVGWRRLSASVLTCERSRASYLRA